MLSIGMLFQLEQHPWEGFSGKKLRIIDIQPKFMEDNIENTIISYRYEEGSLRFYTFKSYKYQFEKRVKDGHYKKIN